MAQSDIQAALETAGLRLQGHYGGAPIPTKKLVSEVVHATGCAPSSVLPSDYAYNRVNRAPISRARPMFIQEGLGAYRFVGADYPYTGPIYWQPVEGGERIVGNSIEGRVTWIDDPRVHS